MILECIPEYTRAEHWANLAKEKNLAFEYNEFFNPVVLNDNEKINQIISIYESLGRDTSNDTLHGAFFDITISSSDPLIRNSSDYRVRQSLDIASRLKTKGVIFHTNYLTDFKSVPYRESWVESNTKYWNNICLEHNHLNIYLENMFDDTPELLTKVAQNLSGVDNFGVCLDIAHAFLSKVPVNEWISALSQHIRHIHINDNDGLQDLHLAVGSGKIDWNILNNPELFNASPSMLIEVNGEEKLNASYDYLNKLGII